MLKSPLIHRIFIFIACLTVGSCALLFSPTSTKAQASSFTSNYTETIFLTPFSGCAGSDLTLEGQIHTVIHVTETPSGQRIVRNHTNFQGVIAADALGNHYRVSTVNNDTTILDDSEQSSFTIVQYFKLIGKGPAANERVLSISHVTINDKGEVTAIFSKSNADCNN
jgi:hypothetical protein